MSTAGYNAALPFVNDTSLSIALSSLQDHDMSLDNLENRQDFFSSLGIPISKAASFIQTHSKTVATIPTASNTPYEADGGVTGNPDVVLAVTVADCLPIFLSDLRSGSFGLVHSGWKGTGIALEAAKLMSRDFNSKFSDIHVLIGPGVGPCCYNVNHDRAAYFSGIAPSSVVHRDGGTFLDLAEANRSLLTKAGIGSVELSNRCSCCSPDLGSFRRQGAAQFTRMLAVIGVF